MLQKYCQRHWIEQQHFKHQLPCMNITRWDKYPSSKGGRFTFILKSYVCTCFPFMYIWRLKHNIGKWVRQKSLFCKQFTGNNYWSSPTEQLNDLRSFFLPIFHSSSLSGCPQLNHGGRSLSWAIVKNQGRYSRHSQKDVCKNWARWQYWQEFLACFLIGSGTIWSFTLFMGTHINKSIAEEGSSKMSKLYLLKFPFNE